ncbi:CerR family C-terminal domain-containing protein [uncultured Desulfobacter sp.]|uniref:CerR family C-terminal domain-containing protein n=1 Tax=uncultured Desulfobacter sp. TaxID=240139 RepID=UPI002AAA7E70|nr:CerR family C-terminal domain-containing protein [uncultured Desulfobacter sp.]
MQKKNNTPGPGTRNRLLETAIDVFGRHGFDQATTRMIAKAAGVNIAAIPYYFGGKGGLYQAVIDFIVEQIKQEAGELFEQIAGANFTGDIGGQHARELIQAFLERFINFIAGSEQGPRFSRIILREQMFPSPAYDTIFEGFLKPVLNALTTLIMAASGESDTRQATLKAMTLMGQVLIFRVARETIVRGLDLEGYSPKELEEIRRVVVANALAITAIPGK